LASDRDTAAVTCKHLCQARLNPFDHVRSIRPIDPFRKESALALSTAPPSMPAKSTKSQQADERHLSTSTVRSFIVERVVSAPDKAFSTNKGQLTNLRRTAPKGKRETSWPSTWTACRFGSHL
jgi:hypothetical protein